MASGGNFKGVATYTAAQNLDVNSRNQPQGQEFARDLAIARYGANFAAVAGGQFVETDFSCQGEAYAGKSGLRV